MRLTSGPSRILICSLSFLPRHIPSKKKKTSTSVAARGLSTSFFEGRGFNWGVIGAWLYQVYYFRVSYRDFLERMATMARCE